MLGRWVRGCVDAVMIYKVRFDGGAFWLFCYGVGWRGRGEGVVGCDAKVLRRCGGWRVGDCGYGRGCGCGV